MIEKDKLFLVSSIVDSSVQSQIPTYNVTLFNSFIALEKYINRVPVVVDTLMITSNELQFTASNMTRLIDLLASPFIRITGNVVYLVDETYNLKQINTFLEMQGITNWAVYQGELTPGFIIDMASGIGRESDEGQVEIVTYRVRASEYIKQQSSGNKYQTEDSHYITDEDDLAGVPEDEEPESIISTMDTKMQTKYVVGGNTIERTIMVFLLAQYISQNNKVVIVEKDKEYHRLTDVVTKSHVDCEFLTMDELYKDISGAIRTMRDTDKKLIVVGAVQRNEYDYNFIVDLLQANLSEYVPFIIKECDYEETPYGEPYTIVVRNTVPDVLECVNSLKYDIDEELVSFIGLQIGELWPVHITSKEMTSVLAITLEKNNICCQVVKAKGVLLKGDEVVYDIFSILDRGNGR